ncbi:MAG: diaminopimelate epimerase [Deltaproteobacteria bacterium]|nr:diaminopimelate epimerase [Deltaproteobacteria bacterium]
MAHIDFWKVEGLGNNFVLLDERDHSENAPGVALEKRIQWCRGDIGIGADGILTLLPPTTVSGKNRALCSLHVTNADGSVPEMCGNGLRCVFRWLVEQKVLLDGEWAFVDTGAGLLRGRVVSDEIEIEMGEVEISSNECEVFVDDRSFRGLDVSVGNPHFVMLEENVELDMVSSFGPLLEYNSHFPNRANIEFSKVLDDEVKLVVWERGVGITQACGTGACATIAAWVERGRLPAERFHNVSLPGGRLSVWIGLDDGKEHRRSVRMRGPARVVFSGKSERA